MAIQSAQNLGNVVVSSGGTATSPDILFLNSSLSGFFLKTDGSIGVSIAGTEVFNFSATGGTEIGELILADGTAAAPGLGFGGVSSNTGLYLAAADSLGFSANGTACGSYSSAGVWTFPNSTTISATTNQLVLGVTNTVTISAVAPSVSRVYSIQDAGSAADFVMTAGAQTLAGIKTHSSAIAITPVTNQLILGTTNTVTISASAPAASRVYTIPDGGGASNIVLDQGAYTIAGAWSHSAAVTLTAASNQLVVQPSGSGFKFSLTAANPAADRVLTIPDPGGAASFVLTAGTQSIAGTATFSGQLIGKGTATNDSAAAGYIGEILSASTLRSAPVSLTSTVTANVTSVSLSAGDWDVESIVGFNPGATTSVTRLDAAVATTSATLPGTDTIAVPDANGQVRVVFSSAANVLGSDFILDINRSRVSVSGTTTIYIVANGTFSISTLAAYGSITARRVR